MADPNDTAARQKKAAENPLVSYFSGQPSQKAPQAPATQAPAAPPAPAANQNAAQPKSTNVGQQAVTNVAPQQGQQAQQTASPNQAKPATGASGFTNYAQYFNANKDAAARTSDAMAGQTALKAAQARKALEDQQAKFSQDVAAGTVGAYDPIHQTANGEVVAAGYAPTPQMTTDQLTAQGQRAYTGPGSLGDEAGITGAYDKANTAQQNLNALGTEGGIQALIQGQNPEGNTGTSRFSGGLVNAAGRGSFDALRAHFNPQKDLADAAKASGTQADAAKALSATNADEWARQAGIQGTAEANAQALAQQKAKADSDAQSAAAQKAMNTVPPQGQESNIMAGIENDPAAQKARGAEFAAFQKAAQSNAGDSVRDVINGISPSQAIAEATGNRNPLGDYFTGTYHPNAGNNSGSTHGDHSPWGDATKTPAEAFWVYRQMTPDQWQEINSLPHGGQKDWIAKRLAQIRAKQDGKPVPGGNNWPKSGGE